MNKYRVILTAGGDDVDFDTIEAKNAKSALRKFLIESERVDEEDAREDPSYFDLLDDIIKLDDWLYSCETEEGDYWIIKC